MCNGWHSFTLPEGLGNSNLNEMGGTDWMWKKPSACCGEVVLVVFCLFIHVLLSGIMFALVVVLDQ